MRASLASTLVVSVFFALACGNVTGGGADPNLEAELDAAMNELEKIDTPSTAGDIRNGGDDGNQFEKNALDQVCCNATEMGDDGPVERYYYSSLADCDPTKVDASPMATIAKCVSAVEGGDSEVVDDAFLDLQTGDGNESICCSKYDDGGGDRAGFEMTTRKKCLLWKTAMVMPEGFCNGKGVKSTAGSSGTMHRGGATTSGTMGRPGSGSTTTRPGGTRSSGSGMTRPQR